jgi:hypothetical protein
MRKVCGAPLVAIQLTAHSNAFAERFVASAKSECLERIVPSAKGTSGLRSERLSSTIMRSPHQGLGNELIAPKTTAIGTDPVTCRARLGGLLKFYYRQAA